MTTPSPEIRSNVPMPDSRINRNKYGFLEKLEVGESAHFVFETKEERNKYRDLLSSNISQRKKREDNTCSWSVSVTPVGGAEWEVGVWRTE